jgi:5'-nucleotidase
MTRLTILHTNDMHARVDQLFRIATLARRIRDEVQAVGGYCTLWDAGDAEDNVLPECNVTKGRAVMTLLASVGYELVALGNGAPMKYGPQATSGLAESLGRPLLCANMRDVGTGQLISGVVPYTIQTFGDLKVGVIGLTATMRSIYDAFDVILDDPVAVLPDLITRVRALGAQTVVLLSHIGSETDRHVAGQVAGLDLIIGGHDHVALDPPLVVNRTIIAQAGDYGRFLGRLDLEIDPASGRITRHHGELIPVGQDIPPDIRIQAAFKVEQEKVQQAMQRVIGELRAPIDLADDRQCAAGNLLADALLDRVQNAQIAMTVAGHWTTGLEVGPLTLGALNSAIRSPANPAEVSVTGAQIAGFLQAALRPENASRQLRVLRGVAVGMPHVAGMRVRYDPASFNLVEAHVGGEPLQPDRRYVVAATDLEFYDFLGYLVIPAEQIRFEVPTIMPEVLGDYIAQRSPLGAPGVDRIVARH